MWQTVQASLKRPAVRQRLLITMAAMVIFSLGTNMPSPGPNWSALETIPQRLDGDTFQFLALFTGGGFSTISIFALGIIPYISASIAVQLSSVIIPKVHQLQREGEVGQKTLKKITAILAVGLGFLQSIGYVMLLSRIDGQPEIFGGLWQAAVCVAFLTLGCAACVALAEWIDRRGLGSGASVLIFASIIQGLPEGLTAYWTNPDPVLKLILPFGLLALLAVIVYAQEGQRRIPIQYARRQLDAKRYIDNQKTYLPLRLNTAGVIPVIFASMIMSVPASLSLYIPALDGLGAFLNPGGWAFLTGEALLIFVFSYLYTAIIFNPAEQADILKSQGGFIPGVRSGSATTQFLDRILTRLTTSGAVFLTLIVIIPTLLLQMTSLNFFIGGISIIICVGVALDLIRRLDAEASVGNYETHMNTREARRARQKMSKTRHT